MKIEITLEKALNFLNKIDSAGYRGLVKCVPVVEKEFKETFLRGYGDVSHIRNKEEMYRLIKSGTNHRALTPELGKPYSEEYLRLKEALGEFYPHKFTEYGFWMGTDVNMIGNALQMKTKPGDKWGMFRGGFKDYLSFHENERSVLKKTFVRSWQKIINTLIENYAEEAQV